MRQLTMDAVHSNLNALNVIAVDDPRPGEPNRRYCIDGFNTAYNPAARGDGRMALHHMLQLFFHDGPVFMDAPLNGVTPESVLMAIADHLHTKQRTQDACVEHDVAIGHIMEAIGALSQRSAVPFLSQDLYHAQYGNQVTHGMVPV